MSQTQRLLRRAAARMMLASFGAGLRLGLIAGAVLFLAYLAVARLLGLVTDHFASLVLAGLGGGALMFALLLIRRPAEQRVARMVDAHAGTKELFLSAVLQADGAGEFLPVVQGEAEQRAPEIDLARVLPFRWTSGALQIVVAGLLVAAALRWVPHLDPFRKVEQRQKSAQQQQKLQEIRKITALRAETLAEESQRQAAQMQQALAKLDKTFKEAQPKEKDSTLKQLGEEQRELGELWRKVNNDQLKQALDKSAQSFGPMNAKERNEWREQLQKGDLSGIKQELGDLRKELAKMAAMPDSAEKRAAQEQLAHRLSQFAEAMKNIVKSPNVDEALSRALAQVDAAKLSELAQEATEDAMKSLELSKQELEQLAQSMKDGKSLEEALKSLQMAKKLAAAGKLDGAAGKDGEGKEDYAALFAAKMAEMELQEDPQGEARAGNGPGTGNGAKRPEDDSVTTGFKSEKSTSMLSNGKMLLEWKSKEVGETGERAEQFREAVRGVKQGVSEALQAEQVPPGYHDAIKKYFDTLPEKK
ncbi:MAG: hypothetical protein ABJF10_00815 [Chthoniobacter sp.]|uniref:hypothetical protein n=1 Tax=Chthoniobacter sp. TaxID=2510640 RepID=UPI0032A6419D